MSRVSVRRILLGLGVCGVVLLAGGCETGTKAKTTTAPVVARFYVETTSANAPVVTLPQSGVQLHIGARPVFSEYDIVRVNVAQVELGQCLLFQLTPAAARDLYRLSVAHHGLRLVVFLNGTAAGARRLEAPIDDGAIAIFVERPDAALPALAAGIEQTSTDVAKARRKTGT